MSWSLGFVSLLVAQLRDVSHPATADLSDCGISVLHSLYHATQTLLDGCPSCQLLDDLIDLAYTSMTSRLDNTCWRRLYTDASLFRTLAVFAEDSSPIEKDILESIAQLDRAIIVAGAAGEGRLDLIWSIIKKIQSQYLPSQNHPKLSLSSSLSSTRLRLETASKLVPQLDVPPSLLAFQTSLRQNPFILRGFACDWPALQERSWQSLEYLRSVTGPGRIVPVEVGKDYRADDWTQRLMSWDDFLTYINSPKGEILYLAQHNIFMQFPSLKMDIIVPDYVYASLDDSLQFPGYRPPCNDEQLVTNVWLGPKGTMSPAHTDPYFNIFVQVVGRKTVWLATPDASPFMSSTCEVSSNPAASQLSNTSSVDVFSTSEFANGERRNHLEFWNNVVPNAMSATMEPGDMLFLPPGWWHGMRSEDSSISVSMWF